MLSIVIPIVLTPLTGNKNFLVGWNPLTQAGHHNQEIMKFLSRVDLMEFKYAALLRLVNPG
jgi:hypothetical protein